MVESCIDLIMDYWFWGSLGFLLCFGLCIRNIYRNGCPIVVGGIAVSAGLYFAVIGARALYVLLFYPQLFLEDPRFALAFWEGTGTWLGGVILGPVGVFLVLKTAKIPFWSNMGSAAPSLALAHAIARIGCLVGGCCFGAPASVPWAIYSEHLNTMVHPTQIYSMIGEVISFAILQTLWKKEENRKFLYPLYGILLAIHRFISEFFRGSDHGFEIIPGLRVFQVVCVFILVVCLCIIVILKWEKKGVVMAVTLSAISMLTIMGARSISRQEVVTDRVGSKFFLVITRDMFAGGLSQWTQNRRKSGFHVVVKSWEAPPSEKNIKQWIKEQVNAAQGTCSYIMIVGDALAEEETPTRWHIPSIKQTFQLNNDVREIYTDVLYGDLNEDGCPDVPVGRLAVRNQVDLKNRIEKIITHDKQTLQPSWFRTVAWIGAENYTRQMSDIAGIMVNEFPEWMQKFMLCADPESIYSGYLPDQPDIFLDQLNRSPMMSYVASHGSFRSITPGHFENKEIFLCNEDVARLKASHPSGIMFLLGCNSGQFNQNSKLGPSLAESFSAHPGGPVGVCASTGPTNPLTNYFFTAAMLKNIKNYPLTFGDYLLMIQRILFQHGQPTFADLARLDANAHYLSAAVPDDEKYLLYVPGLLRKEMLMYNLIGDPSCTLNLPKEITISSERDSSGKLRISGSTPTPCSKLFLELVDSGDAEKMSFSGAEPNQRRQALYKANQPSHILLERKITGKEWTVKTDLNGGRIKSGAFIRVIAVGKDQSYIGSVGIH